MYIPGIDGIAEDSENDILREAIEKASKSALLQHPVVSFAALARYHVLSRWPWALLALIILYHIFEHVPENSKVSGSTLLRSLLAWLQWFLVLVCSLTQVSYAPDLFYASLLPTPTYNINED